MQTQSEGMRQKMEQFMEQMPCPVCKGKRLKPVALAVKLKGKNIAETTALTLETAYEYFQKMSFNKTETEIAKQAMKEIFDRLRFLNSVGVGYLTLDRIAGSLSGGEAQRIRLASQLGSELSGVNPWLGRVALFAIYDRALASDEIRRNFTAGMSAPAP